MPRKGENIYKRKDGRWEGRYIKGRASDGKAVYGYVYARTYREVKGKILDKRLSMSQPDGKDDGDECGILFGDIAAEWFQMIKPQVKESTQNKYQNLLESYILTAFGETSLCHMTHPFMEAQCREWLCSGGKKGRGLSPKTVSDILSIVRGILQFAQINGNDIPCDGRSIQIKNTVHEMRVLSRKEQEKLCQYLYSDLNACNIGILISLFTGLRVGEICALRWEDISISEQTIHICRTMQRIQDKSGKNGRTKIVVTTPKSPCSIRTIPIPEELMQILISFQTSRTGYFLTGSCQKYMEPRTMQNRFKAALKNCSVSNANYHALRHTFATRCVELGFDVKSLSEILGHANVNITMNRYVHPSMELKKANMQRLSGLFIVK